MAYEKVLYTTGHILLMGESKKLVTEYSCERCGHKWIPRNKCKPIICPKCKSPYWYRPKIVHKLIKTLESDARKDQRMYERNLKKRKK